jgi:integrase
VTLAKLRFLLSRAVKAFGGCYLDELDPIEISAWRMTVPPGYRFEATQALRQVLARAVVWGMLDVNPAKQGVENPQRKRTEKRPFESWEQTEALAERLGPRLGPMVFFAAATGMRPGEWVALEHRDIDRAARVAYVNRSFGKGRLTTPKTEASIRAVPLQARALAALDQLQHGGNDDLLFPADRGGYLDLHNFRNRDWKPAQLAVGIEPFRRIYDLRHTFATFALRAGISTFRTLALHGRQPDHDRPPLRPPRPRRPRARNPPARQPQRPRGGRSWTLGGRPDAGAPPDQTTKEAAEQAIIKAL